ncbi:MAG: membrane protein insertase YidC [Christensenellaceae bacterium]|jgi:YidC/Oxa1 family membrane protein insertase|nr:membrane protein insertase YidC [Christensenellaceae bacterium]
MGNLINLLQGLVEFPAKGSGWFPFIGKFVYVLAGAMHNHGALNYGLALIFFTIILKLVLFPMDFANKYFTKKNAKFMAKIKPEEDLLKEQYKDDMMKLNQARQALYKKHGYKMGGFCLFTIINLFLTLAIFMSIFTSLRAVATHNVVLAANNLEAVYYQYRDDPDGLGLTLESSEFKIALNDAYTKHNTSFLWIKNIWHEDVPWSSGTLTVAEYVNNRKVEITDAELDVANQAIADELGVDITALPDENKKSKLEMKIEQYDFIYANLDASHKRNWNGLLILVVLAGVTSWGSSYITARLMKTKKKTDESTKPKEAVAVYSMRDAKDQTDPKAPQVDPAVVGKIMMFVLPAIMIFFTMSSTAALAIYIITNSLLSTIIAFGLGWPVDKLLAWQDKHRKARGLDPDETDKSLINPHAKYFKRKKK